MLGRRDYLKTLGGTALGTIALGTAAVESVAAEDDSTAGTWHSSWQSYDVYDKLDDRHGTFKENLTYSLSPAQSAPQGEWSIYLCAQSTTICRYDDTEELAPLVGFKRTEFEWPESDGEHVEYPESTNDDWIGGNDHEKQNDGDFWIETGEFALDSAEFVVSLADEAIPNPIDVGLAAKNYAKEVVEYADDIGGWFDSWDRVDYEWRDHNQALHTSFVLCEFDRVEPGEEVRFRVNTYANERRNPPEASGAGAGWAQRSGLENSVTAPDYESPPVF